jgi:hypothetical protein
METEKHQLQILPYHQTQEQLGKRLASYCSPSEKEQNEKFVQKLSLTLHQKLPTRFCAVTIVSPDHTIGSLVRIINWMIFHQIQSIQGKRQVII